MFEIASASGAMLIQDTPGRGLCLYGVSIPSPVVLTVAGNPLMDCNIECKTGRVELQSITNVNKKGGQNYPVSLL